jgi:hypothetical protein
MSKKIALCFIINYEHILYKESIWKEWIEPNKDIINVYFFYSDLKKIRSPWIYKHTIPEKHLRKTSYYHVIPAYFSILNFALMHDKKNKWFCYLTDSCCPIISPSKFRELFEKNYNKSVMRYLRAHWNIELHRRANLSQIPKEYHLANDPWFVLTREHAIDCINFALNENNLYNLICQGGMANESLFSIILTHYKKINNVIPQVTHLTDWVRMSSTTSPHLFKEGNDLDIAFIKENLDKNKYAMFIRKVHPSFPDEILREFINNTKFSQYHILTNYFISFLIGSIFLVGFFILIYYTDRK